MSPKENASSLLGLMPRICTPRRSKFCPKLGFSSRVLAYSGAVVNPARSAEEKVYQVVLKQAALVKEQSTVKRKSLDLDERIVTEGLDNWDLLDKAYDRCGEVCAEYAKTFYLGKKLFWISAAPPSSICFCGVFLLSVYLFIFFFFNGIQSFSWT